MAASELTFSYKSLIIGIGTANTCNTDYSPFTNTFTVSCKTTQFFKMEFYLGHENISRGTVKKLHCQHCGFECDCFKIVGDTEAMNFLGVIGLTNLDAKEIFITHLTRQEFQEYRTIDSKIISERLEKLLKRSNLVYFRNKFDTQGRLFLSCPRCGSEMAIINEISLYEYVEKGGKIYTIGNYPND